MSRYKTYRVCKYCFNLTKTSNPPILEKSNNRGTCTSCGGEWVGINVGYYHPDKKYYEVRRRVYYSEDKLCSLNINDKCDRSDKCRYAHNRLELELWIEEEKLLTEMKNAIPNKISCIICKVEFRDISILQTHLQSREHVGRTNGMKILPEVGSSLEYKGPIRARPKVPFNQDTYELCRNFVRHGRCDFLTGCKQAHSEEELIVWLRAKMDEERTLERNEEISSRSNPPISSRHSSGEASEYYWSVQGEVQILGIEDVFKNRPKHIEILCNNHLEQILDESPKEFRWIFRIKSSKREVLRGITLYEDRNMFKLEGVHKGVEEKKYSEIKFPYIQNRTCYQLHQQLDNIAMFIDVTLAFKPKIGQHQVYIVIECMDGGLVARKVKVKVEGIAFKEREKSMVKKNNSAETSKTRNSISPCEDVVPLQDHTEEAYQNKSNSLHGFITLCQQEITQVHANTEITAAINEQLKFVNISLGNLERQRYLEQQKTQNELKTSHTGENTQT